MAATLRDWGSYLLDRSATLTEALRCALYTERLVTVRQLMSVHGALVTDTVVLDLLTQCLWRRTRMWDALVDPTHSNASLRCHFPRDRKSPEFVAFVAQCLLDMGKTPHDVEFMFTIVGYMKKIRVVTPTGKALTLYVAEDTTDLAPSMTAAFRVEG